jgi:hypothetical protein
VTAKKSTKDLTPRRLTPRRLALKPTDIPNVYTNRAGVIVDEDGVALGFTQLKKHDSARFAEVLDGGEVSQPADLLKAVSLDPRMPLHVRLDAASKAAPYFTAKRVAVQGVAGEPPVSINLSSLKQQDLDKLEQLLVQAYQLMEQST